MKTKSLNILTLIFVMLTIISFDRTSPKLIDSNSKTQIESLVEDAKLEKALDENVIDNVSGIFLNNLKLFTEFESLMTRDDQFYLSNIFKPPKFS